jgi:hypothetical protein
MGCSSLRARARPPRPRMEVNRRAEAIVAALLMDESKDGQDVLARRVKSRGLFDSGASLLETTPRYRRCLTDARARRAISSSSVCRRPCIAAARSWTSMCACLIRMKTRIDRLRGR